MCLGANVTLQCTVTGSILIWRKHDGDINLIRGLHTNSILGSYQWKLIVLDNDRLQSFITFWFSNQITINCSNNADQASIDIVLEGTQKAAMISDISV